MGYQRVNITIPENLWAATQTYLQEHNQPFSRLIQELLSERIHSSKPEMPRDRGSPDTISEDWIREIVRDELTRVSAPEEDIQNALATYEDPAGLAERLDAWLLENHMSIREFRQQFGIQISNKSRWKQGRGLTEYTARQILRIIDPPDTSRNGEE
jgi:hypothetical protein